LHGTSPTNDWYVYRVSPSSTSTNWPQINVQRNHYVHAIQETDGSTTSATFWASANDPSITDPKTQSSAFNRIINLGAPVTVHMVEGEKFARVHLTDLSYATRYDSPGRSHARIKIIYPKKPQAVTLIDGKSAGASTKINADSSVEISIPRQNIDASPATILVEY